MTTDNVSQIDALQRRCKNGPALLPCTVVTLRHLHVGAEVECRHCRLRAASIQLRHKNRRNGEEEAQYKAQAAILYTPAPEAHGHV